MITFTNEFLRDKIYACWLGKNIGGTLGTPYEGQRDMHDIQGFASKPGEPLPNDDLDLQLVWLRAVTEWGPDAINSKLLGEYWLTYASPSLPTAFSNSFRPCFSVFWKRSSSRASCSSMKALLRFSSGYTSSYCLITTLAI